MATHVGDWTTVSGHSQSDFSVRQVDPKIHLLQSNIAPISTVLMNMRGRGVLGKATNTKVEWMEMETLPHTDTVGSGGAVDSATAIPVSNVDLYSEGDFVLVKSANGDEWIGPLSNIDTGNNEIDVASTSQRGALGTSAVALTAAEPIIIFRGHIEDGGDPANKIAQKGEMIYNHVEPVSTPFQVSDFLETEATYGGINSLSDLEKRKMIDHMEELEKRVLYGERHKDSSTGRYHMGGLFYYITSTTHNVLNSPKDFAESDWNTYLRKAFKYDQSSGRRTVFASGEVVETLDSFKLADLELRNDDLMKNVASFSYRSSFGQVDIVRHRMLDSAFGTDWYAIGLDLSEIEWMTFIPQQIRRNLPSRKHHTEHEIYQVNSMKVLNEAAHSIFYVTTS